MTLANSVLDALIAGNTRFREGLSSPKPWQSAKDCTDQNPIAIILGCSDARVPIEIIFDQGPGDLFVIRVAGNIVAPSQVGSVEFAALQFQVPLVVVMGHTRCGAIDATFSAMTRTSTNGTNSRSKVAIPGISNNNTACLP